MKAKQLIITAAAGLIATHAWAESPKMNMTTEIPTSITTPDRVETSIGTFEFFDGVPTKKSTEMAYDFLDKVNAYKALLSTIPTVSINELRRGQAAVGAKTCNQIPINTLVPEDASAFAWMHEIIEYEPAEAFGKEKLGRLASLGIEKGRPFEPDARMRQILEKAAQQGVAMSRVIAFESRKPEARVYPKRMWESPFIGNSSTFDPKGYRDLEARTTFHFTADGITPAMAAQMPEGKGSRYQTTYRDSDGKYLDGSKTYKMNMPPRVPVALFWSVVIYDPWSRCELQSVPYPSLSSQSKPAPKANADGSIDVYFGPARPRGVAKQNWIRTLPDRGFFVYIRYYGPLKAFNDKTWVPNDVELVK